jgi:HEAT repeat protein
VDWDAASAPASGHGETLGGYAAAQERRQWQQRLQGTDLTQLLSQLQAVFAREPVDPEALDNVFQQLQWLVRLDPRAAAAIAEQVGARTLQGNTAAAAISALAAANTDAGQQALLELRSHADLDLSVRQAATIAMFQLATPSPATLATLAGDAAGNGDLTGAMLVLGALAPRAGSPLADGRTALQTLSGLEDEMTRRGELPAWLLAMGNAATPETLAAAGRHLDDGDASVRAAACTALQNVPGDGAMQALIERGLGDQDASVRIEAVRALDHRSEPAATAALRQAAANDADPEVRSAALRALSRNAGTGSCNRQVLEQASAGDPSAQVRDLARWLLQQGS